jgi:hypothetical protein
MPRRITRLEDWLPWLLAAFILFLFLATSGCASQPSRQAPEVIEVPGPIQYRDIPDELLDACPAPFFGRPGQLPRTNGELLEQWRSYREMLQRCAGAMEAIRRLQKIERHND